MIGYVANNESVTNPAYVITENTEDKLVIVANFSGISWQYIYKPKPDVFDVDGPGNFWKSASVSMTYWYSPSDWSGGLNQRPKLLRTTDLKSSSLRESAETNGRARPCSTPTSRCQRPRPMTSA